MALYRKYRPATFAEVVGQEHVTDPLSTALDTGRISHAYLFSGPRGCGKTSSARILARSLNCVDGPTSTPCGTCSSCVALGPGGSGNLDVIELDAASHGGVDDTRELRDRAFYAPAESRYRVFIVDEAHMVTTAGFNALLKIVEEPPAHLIFIFATTEPDKVLPTIRSRTHHYPFRLLPPATMRGLLGKICEQENVPVEEAVYPLVIRAGGGSPRDSLSVLDQLLAGAGPDGVTYPRAVSLLGVTDVALIDDAIDALAADDGAALFNTVDQVMEAGHDPRRFAVDLLERLRDLILLRAVPDAADRGLVSGPGDVMERMRDQAERLGPATLTRYAELLHEGLGEMRGATAPRLLLEVICARMLLPSVSDTESATLQRLERLERGFAGGSVPAPARPGPAAGEAPAERPSAPTPSGESRRRGAELLAAARAEKEAATGGSSAPGAASPVVAEQKTAAPAAPATSVPTAPPAPASTTPSAAVTSESTVTPAATSESTVAPTAPAAESTVIPAAVTSDSTPAAAPRGQAAPPVQSAESESLAESTQTAAPAGQSAGAVPPVDSARGVASSSSNEVAPEPLTPENSPTEGGNTERSDLGARPASVGAEQQSAPPTEAAAPRRATESTPVPEAVAPQADSPVQPDPAPATAPVENAPAQTEPQVSAAKPPAVAEDLVAIVDAAWPEIKGRVREFGATLQALLSGAAVSRVDGDVIVFAHQSPPLAQRLSDPRNIDAVRSAVRAVLGRELDVRWETGAPAPRPAPAAKAGAARGTGTPESKPAGRPKFSRPSQAGGNQSSNRANRPPDDDIPPPDFPDLPDDPGPDDGPESRSGSDSARSAAVLAPPTPEEEREMLAAAAVPVAPGDRQDPDEVALALLREQFGAKSLDG
ncbi:DNA polymerase III subunit gamma and tau [Nocardia sp. PE-7]|uniref:DNA polymerase III subunit gamma and tau n=1 Tax=Nocardia sp. PE-7 TaxID=3058426 RepID=UPI002657B713|nr:DNA polymerase III subunit gamma and tau [Nocardia sp. PE-7]WKG09843.1 DNA polymerase III subunit gamma and tau [Nocardia sp. PE-7]